MEFINVNLGRSNTSGISMFHKIININGINNTVVNVVNVDIIKSTKSFIFISFIIILTNILIFHKKTKKVMMIVYKLDS